MATVSDYESQNFSIRPLLRRILEWPLKVAQIVGQFPLTQSRKDNEFSFKWNSAPMYCIYLNFLVTITLTYNYFVHKEEIVTNVMGPLTKTEHYAGSFITLFVLFTDKFLTIYSILIRKFTINFQTKLNTILQEIIDQVGHSPKFQATSIVSPFIRGPVIPQYISYFERERKSINKIGLSLLLFGSITISLSILFHVLGLFNGEPDTDICRTLILIISCVFGACLIAAPKLCYFYYILSIINKLKVGFAILKGTVKEQEARAMQKLGQMEEISDRIDSVLDMHSKLEKVVRKYNQVFGIQLLSCIIVSLVLIIGNSFLSCVNFTFNAWYILLVTIPITLLPFICFFLACHNASQMTLEAQKTVIRLRNFKLKLRPELELRIILHYTKAVSNPPAICPMSFTAINYHTVFSAVAMIATYLFILLQFKAGEGETGTGSGNGKEFGWMLQQALEHGNFSGGYF